MTYDMIQLQKLFEDYFAEVDRLHAKSKPTDGMFGMGTSPKNDPCHERFYDQVGYFVEQAVAAGISPHIAYAMTEYLLRAEVDRPEKPQEVRWMLVAVQGHAKQLIGKLERDHADALLGWYARQYPWFRRLPVQKEIVEQLKKQSK